MNFDADALLESVSGASSSERYIILMNNTLQERNKEHLLTIKKMEINLEDLYESLSKAESRVENLNGLLTDLHQNEADLRELSEKDAKVIETTRYELRNYKIKAKTHLRYLQIIMIVFSSFYYEFHGFNTFAPIAMMLIVIAAFQESTLDGMVIR
jgi:DNA repair exonuclease SbcCD ATPase subunit